MGDSPRPRPEPPHRADAESDNKGRPLAGGSVGSRRASPVARLGTLPPERGAELHGVEEGDGVLAVVVPGTA